MICTRHKKRAIFNNRPQVIRINRESSQRRMQLIDGNEVSLYFNTVPENIDASDPPNNAVAVEIGLLKFATSHEKPFPLPHYCAVGSLLSVASATQTNDLSRGVILQHDNATHTAAAAVVSTATSGPPAILFGLL